MPFVRYNISTVIKATFGRDIVSVDDELFSLAEQTTQIIRQEDVPGAALVDLLPICECLHFFQY